MPLDPKEVLAAVVGPPPEELKNLLGYDQLLVELRERAGTEVTVTVARLPSYKVVSEAAGGLHLGDEPHKIVVDGSLFVIDPAAFRSACWFDDEEISRRLLYADLGPIWLAFDFNLHVVEVPDAP